MAEVDWPGSTPERRQLMSELADHLQMVLPAGGGKGFVLLVFDEDPHGQISYISSAPRSTAALVIQSLLARLAN